MKKLLNVLLISLTTLMAHGQNATITGTVTALENGKAEPQPFTNVVIKGSTTGASTDLDGQYRFQVAPGTHTVVVSLVGYVNQERTVTLAPGESITLDFALKGEGIEMRTFEITKEKRRDTESAVLMETRTSEQVVNGMGRQQIAKGQDRTAGDVVKRIPGVTMTGDRFIMIRGLAERYNTVTLNDVIAPSLEADKRAFSFDLIPSGALDRIMIHKTAAPELPGEFAGGVIKIGTLGVPEQNETRFSYSTSFRNGTTFKPFASSDGSPTDALGFDNGFRQLPSAFPASLNTVNNAEQLASLGRSLPNNWSANSSTAIPDQRGSFLIARRFGKEGGANSFGTVTSVDYANTLSAYTANNYNYNAFDANTQRSDTIYAYKDRESIRNARVTVLSNWTALLGSRTKLEFRNLFNQLGEERTTERTGRDLDGGFDVRNFAYRWQQRSIYSGQLHGRHDLADDRTVVEWTAGYGFAKGKEPDYRRVRTTRPLDQADSDAPYQVQVPPTASTADAGRYYSELNERVITARADVEHALPQGGGDNTFKLRAGFFAERKDRDFSARWMSFARSNFAQFDQDLLYAPLDEVFSAANINTTNGFKLVEGTNPSDSYTAANTLMAGYVGGSVGFGKLATVSGGVRVESNRQELTSATYNGGRVNVDNPVLSILPSLNASYNTGEKSLVRIAASSTVNRPEFRELAPFNFYDFSTNTSLFGNPDLKTAKIMNLDGRWELYPSTSEVFSVGAFYKDFTDPIEMFFVSSTGGGTRTFSYGNAERATSLGVEVEVRRTLGFLTESAWGRRLGVTANASLIRSRVDLGAQAVGQEQERPLMGQSPYVANAGLYYEVAEEKLRVSALWNVFGKRLYAVGSDLFPNIYEMPRHSLDITATKGLGEHFEVKLGVQDLLNQRTLLVQDSDANGEITPVDEQMLSFRRGSYFTAGLSYRF
ncbi:MAG: TonB-dependent receptor [Flavobacteriales bacterium]|nr:TonB-dependent receptor [Flavobacteriales bacterium]